MCYTVYSSIRGFIYIYMKGENIIMFPEEIIAAFLAEEMDEEDAMEELEEYGIDLEDYDDEYDEW